MAARPNRSLRASHRRRSTPPWLPLEATFQLLVNSHHTWLSSRLVHNSKVHLNNSRRLSTSSVASSNQPSQSHLSSSNKRRRLRLHRLLLPPTESLHLSWALQPRTELRWRHPQSLRPRSETSKQPHSSPHSSLQSLPRASSSKAWLVRISLPRRLRLSFSPQRMQRRLPAWSAQVMAVSSPILPPLRR